MAVLGCAFNKRIADELTIRARNGDDTSGRTWSDEQLPIFDWFKHPDGSNLVVEAYAGTGKTTTIMEGIRRAPEGEAVFKTLHAIGFSIVKRFWEGINIERDYRERPEGQLSRADWLTAQVTTPQVPDAIKRLVSTLHTKAREIKPHARNAGELIELAYDFECAPDDMWAQMGYPVQRVEEYALAAMELAANHKPVDGIDYSDMIYLPVRNKWCFPQYGLVVVDEAQDMTIAQLEIASGVCSGRMCIVGDPNQAIYGFRGADSGSLGRLQHELKARKLPLTVTYRCGRNIVREAQRLVPGFQAAEGNSSGIISTLPIEKLVQKAEHGDFILSRINAPLVELAIQLLRSGKRARIAGQDIGKGLNSLIKKMKARSIPELLDKLSKWEVKEVDRWTKAKRKDRINAVRDKVLMIHDLADGARGMDHLKDKIDVLFTDDGLGQAGVITLSSVHKAKGLEADRVFILAGTLYIAGVTPEEKNIEYVAITRAKKELIWVGAKRSAEEIRQREEAIY